MEKENSETIYKDKNSALTAAETFASFLSRDSFPVVTCMSYDQVNCVDVEAGQHLPNTHVARFRYEPATPVYSDGTYGMFWNDDEDLCCFGYLKNRSCFGYLKNRIVEHESHTYPYSRKNKCDSGPHSSFKHFAPAKPVKLEYGKKQLTDEQFRELKREIRLMDKIFDNHDGFLGNSMVSMKGIVAHLMNMLGLK